MNLLKEFTCKCSFLSGGSTVGDSSCTLDRVKSICRSVAKDVCSPEVLRNSSRKATDSVSHSQTMRRLVLDLSRRHDIVFAKLVKVLAEGSKPENGRPRIDEGLTRVLSEMFKDGQINWGRVVAVYAFANCLADYCLANDLIDMVENVSVVTGSFVENNLSEWIYNQGGWDSFEQNFQEEESTESKLWKGLVCTFIGLGTLATITTALK